MIFGANVTPKVICFWMVELIGSGPYASVMALRSSQQGLEKET